MRNHDNGQKNIGSLSEKNKQKEFMNGVSKDESRYDEGYYYFFCYIKVTQYVDRW